LRRQRSLLPAPRRLARVPLIADAGRPLPLARPIGIIGLIKRLRAGSRCYDSHRRQHDGSHRASHGYPPVMALSRLSSLLTLIEISQIRRGLPLLGWHQVAVRAEKIVLFPDGEVVIVLGAIIFDPIWIMLAPEFLGDGPWARQRVGDGRGFGVMNVRIGFI